MNALREFRCYTPVLGARLFLLPLDLGAGNCPYGSKLPGLWRGRQTWDSPVQPEGHSRLGSSLQHKKELSFPARSWRGQSRVEMPSPIKCLLCFSPGRGPPGVAEGALGFSLARQSAEQARKRVPSMRAARQAQLCGSAEDGWVFSRPRSHTASLLRREVRADGGDCWRLSTFWG